MQIIYIFLYFSKIFIISVINVNDDDGVFVPGTLCGHYRRLEGRLSEIFTLGPTRIWSLATNTFWKLLFTYFFVHKSSHRFSN